MTQVSSSSKISADPDFRGRIRYRIFFAILRPFILLLCRVLFRYKAEIFPLRDPQQNFIVVSNHTGALDPFFVAASFLRPIFFVASDHLFRLGWVSKLINWLVAPIPIVKTGLDLKSLRTIEYELSRGRSVGLFPSGNRSRSGPEEPIPKATGKFLKRLDTTVLFYRISGGYLSSPRWAKSPRKGHMTGKVIASLSRDELRNMKASEIQDKLIELLDDNPYRAGHEMTQEFHGKDLAEHLERILWLCPECGGVCTLSSEGNLFSCPCGFALRYTETGVFASPDDSPEALLRTERFPHPHAMRLWQDRELKKRFSSPHSLSPDEAIYSDSAETLILTKRAERNTAVLNGRITLFSDRLQYDSADGPEQVTFPLENLGDLTCIGPQKLQFHDKVNSLVYESVNSAPRSAYKYIDTIALLKSKPKEGSL